MSRISEETHLRSHSYLAVMVEPIFDYQFRLILIGDSTVGKSSLLKYFTDGKFFEVSKSSVAERSSWIAHRIDIDETSY